MKISRSKTRRFLLQFLYSKIYGEVDAQRFHEAFFEWILDFAPDREYLSEMEKLVPLHMQEIIAIIHHFAPKFEIETMLKTNILAIAIAITEMKWLPEEIPAKVSINEAIELAKYFWDDSSKSIVNGILNSFYEKIESLETQSLPKYEKAHFF